MVGQYVQITDAADQEPIISVRVGGVEVPMMIDTGATFTCIQAKYADHLPLSGQFVKTVGFSGKATLTQMTMPVPVTIGNKTTHVPVLVCSKTPLNLLGRDAILGLGLKLECTNQGINLTGMYPLRIRGEEWANVYWLGNIEEQIREQVWKTWGKFVEAQIPKAEWPKTELHSTMIFDEKQEPEIQEKWEKEAGQEQEVKSGSILIGPEGAALTIIKNEWVNKWFSVPGTEPHITLKVNPEYRPKDLGPMVLRARELEFVKTDNANIWMSSDGQMMKILSDTEMVGKPKQVRIEVKDKEQEQEWREKLEKDLNSLPQELWSKQDTDVGRVKTAIPVEIRLKQGCQGPYRPQYPIKSEAIEGIKETIRGLVEVGVLQETQSR